METRKTYQAPRLVHYGPIGALTRGSGHNLCDFAIGHNNNDTGNSTDTGTGISNGSECFSVGGS